MPFVPVANTVLVEFRMTADLQQVENTLWFEYPGPPSAVELSDLATELITWWMGQYADLIWSGVVLREVVVTDMTTASGLQVTLPAPSGANGQLSVPPLPTNVSLTVSFRTALRGRSFRGRNYVVGLVEDQTTGANTLDTAVLTGFTAAYQALIAIASGVGATWVVVSRFSGIDANGDPIPRAAGVTTPITNVIIVDNVVDSQRRRLPGRGT